MTNPTIGLGQQDKQGDTWVRTLQATLNEENSCNLSIDGEFGPNTQRELLVFQGRAGLTVDGLCGPATWRALGFIDFTPEDEFPDIDDWRGEMRMLLLRYQTLMWLGAPLLAVIPIWTSNRDHPIEGSGWIGPIIIAVLFIPIWLMFGYLFLAFRKVFAGEEEQEKRTRLACIAEQELAIRRAERLRNARLRLTRIQQDREAKQSRRLALDIDRIRRELDVDDDGEADSPA